LVFGTEINGISDEVKKEADAFVKIPMYGFTESFNISVSAAICLYELTSRMRKELSSYHLSHEEKNDLYLDWCMKSIDTGDLLVRKWIKEKGILNNN
jgi:tRNA (guanosine-2'-O-)-methyltransferase